MSKLIGVVMAAVLALAWLAPVARAQVGLNPWVRTNPSFRPGRPGVSDFDPYSPFPRYPSSSPYLPGSSPSDFDPYSPVPRFLADSPNLPRIPSPRGSDPLDPFGSLRPDQNREWLEHGGLRPLPGQQGSPQRLLADAKTTQSLPPRPAPTFTTERMVSFKLDPPKFEQPPLWMRIGQHWWYFLPVAFCVMAAKAHFRKKS